MPLLPIAIQIREALTWADIYFLLCGTCFQFWPVERFARVRALQRGLRPNLPGMSVALLQAVQRAFAT